MIMTLHQINEELENLLEKARRLDEAFFKLDKKYTYKLRIEKQKTWNRINFLKCMKKIYIMKK